MGVFLLNAVSILFELYYYLMLFYIISSWFPNLRNNKVGYWAGNMVEPYLTVFRRFIPPMGMLDLSPIVAFFAYRYITMFIMLGLTEVLQFIKLV